MSGCAALELGEQGFLLYLCLGGAMWDDPSSPGLTAHLNAVVEREWREHELELDLVREAELCPPTEELEPEVFPPELSAAIEEWDAYR